MEKFSIGKFNYMTEKKIENSEEDIFKRVEEHSRKFDKEIADTRIYPSSEIKKVWQIKEWKIGDAKIKAIGVSHVPETFLEYRQEIEQAIKESDIVVNEFAPEALGFYDKESAQRLKKIKSLFNENYNLEQVRQVYCKYERFWNKGVFHHEIELLAAKYGKDMAVVDLASRDPEKEFQDYFLYTRKAEQIAEQIATLKKIGLYGGAAGLGVAGLLRFLEDFQKPMSRRKFLSLGLVGGSAIIAGITSKITEVPPNTSIQKSAEGLNDVFDSYKIEMLRDPKLADALECLVRIGYKNIVFIYGSKHINRVEEYLNNPEKRAKKLAIGKEIIQKYNPDSFRVYRLVDGENHSEKFVASKNKVWKRINFPE